MILQQQLSNEQSESNAELIKEKLGKLNTGIVENK